MYKLKNINGRVNSLLRSGNDFVKNNISVSAAQHIIDNGKMLKSELANYPICIDNEWFFEGEEINETKLFQDKKNPIERKVEK